MKTNLFTFTFIAGMAFSIHLNGQNSLTSLKKEKYNDDKTMEDGIGYAQAVKVGNTIYVSGSVGWGPWEDALKIAYAKINKSLANYGVTFENVVKENIYTTALDSLIRYKDVRRTYYRNDFPAGTWVEVKRLYSAGLVVEIEVVAVIPDKK